MSTASPSRTAADTLLNPESLAPYFDKLAATQSEIGTALKEGQARTQRIGNELMDAYLTSQREMLDLTKQLMLKPQDYAGNLKAMVDASATAQERAIALAKLFYSEQSDVAGNLRKWFQSTCESTGNMTEAGRTFMNFWSKPTAN